jgi:hypothetical protein
MKWTKRPEGYVALQFALGLLAGILIFAAATCSPADAAIRVNLVTRLNELLDDANNRKMSAANKILFMDDIGKEYGRRGLYVKRDTVLLVAETERYTLNSDFAGVLQGAYLKSGQDRTILPIIDRDSAFRIPDVKAGVVSYLFVEEDGSLGVHAIPLYADTIVLLYYATPAALSGDSTEWGLPDYYEGAALFEAAASCLLKIGTAEAQAKATSFLGIAAAKLDELRNAPSQTRKIGDTPR